LSLGLETIGGVMKKLIPRNTTIPVRRSDIFSTAENNQTLVEIHVLQGEREMAADNKSLGRFKLTGIPPAPRGVPQVQVSFDIDANGILQVTALDRTTGREQSITVQGASTLSEGEVNRMIQEAEQYASTDRERRERVEKRNRAEALAFSAERQLKEVALTFGMQFAAGQRRRIENLVQEMRQSIARDDDRAVDRAQSDLQDALYELNREVRMESMEDEDDFFGSIRRTFSGDGDSLFGNSTQDRFEGSRYQDRSDGSRYQDYPDRSEGTRSRDRSEGSRYQERSEGTRSRDRYDDDRRSSGSTGGQRYSRDSDAAPRRTSRIVQPEDDWDDDDDWL
jgi:molecular chaperone DnaK